MSRVIAINGAIIGGLAVGTWYADVGEQDAPIEVVVETSANEQIVALERIVNLAYIFGFDRAEDCCDESFSYNRLQEALKAYNETYKRNLEIEL